MDRKHIYRLWHDCKDHKLRKMFVGKTVRMHSKAEDRDIIGNVWALNSDGMLDIIPLDNPNWVYGTYPWKVDFVD